MRFSDARGLFSGEACHAILCRQGTALINATGDKQYQV
ncbi:hypothetical protein MA4S0726RB_2202 [Mycobacteroides abscessus 4S-0726-RB]|nr:hypothetical protein MA4S0726RA_2612 [Mycobacteroides abscessus 4S-0726-RA]EIT97141.1 hypothetical protein MA4S0303_2678 [Mycobacteroides abscessus 4S-0303]EIT98425.1 hypothetical protein MA4S0726RB_2202 [Mycobacteroides abscessus 4S-0726-RB]EIV10026.1 hypothetical protein MA4S0206_2699 [Mycobacteroides abscessus 4S-0206]EIV50725.1 hypothetical protein MA4S0116R_2659 [Mycobacteroides abscessus 4S-0116-R]EIV63256.1 hypothetical protein MA4S0116S_1750 [Mycobacteroides abscessus 4S-0116-S]